ncbi:hypothetical protein FHR22_002608 [Sphingopyxis panaciterrae]|uniref:hypothetical protein n=1 Tax=Sphingopyxis panaciterrae TaxID=363841 RepID=UPI001422569D|nr:hypothetical protein [Sphingopyxis panaciterrae]NIJ37905.1 hypothetical protein [Sphingopyxis panaciterrae]
MVSIRRSGMAALAVRIDAAPVALDVPRGREALEAAMAEAVRLSWLLTDRTGSSPFASDGPWHLMTRDLRAGDYDARGGDMDDAPAPRETLGVVDMALIERLGGWLTLLARRHRRGSERAGAVSDGAVVAAVMRQYATGRSQVDWGRVMKAVGLDRGKGALRHRYDRAMDWLAAEVAKGR